VVVEHGGGGSTMAAPNAADVLREALRIDPRSPAPGQTAAATGVDAVRDVARGSE
jgi:hypothetical protein